MSAVSTACARHAGTAREHVQRLAVLPTTVSRAELGMASALAALPIGIADSDLTGARIDLSEMHCLIVGPYRSGRSTALATIARAVRECQSDAPLFLLSPRRNSLRDLDIWTQVAAGADECKELANGIAQSLATRPINSPPSFLFIHEAGDITDSLTLAALEHIVKRGRDLSLRVIAAMETSAGRGVGVPWVRELRKEGHGLLMQPNLGADGEILGVQLPRRVATPLVPGRGFLVSQGTASLVHIAM